MEPLPVRVGVLHAGEITPEQRAALDWCGRDTVRAEPVPLAGLAAGDLAEYDVCWWHRDEPFDGGGGGDENENEDSAGASPAPGSVEATAAAAAPAVRAFLADGGGLLVTLRALSAVVPLGIEPVAPDATGVAIPGEPVGYRAAALHADHPVFEGFDGERVFTHGPGGEAPVARYDEVVPATGDVLGCGIRGDTDARGSKPLIAWQHGDGRVLGAGAWLSFRGPADEAAARGHRLVRNALAALGAGRVPAVRRPAAAGRCDAASGAMASRASAPRPGESAGAAAVRDRMRALRRALADDHHRPRYHLAPPANWLNDPNGLIRRGDTYHLFYQYNPAGPFHDTIHWGHATSDDLIQWRDEPVALTPSPDGPDRDGCWSGCAVDDGGAVTLLYTGGRGRHQLPCLATTDDPELCAWEKDPGNPIIESPPAEFDALSTEHWAAEFRDHCVWAEGDTWYHVIGSGTADGEGAALLYAAENLREWEYVGTLLVGGPGGGPVWECPELLRFDDYDLLHVSDGDDVRYALGEASLDEPDFEVERWGVLDHGEFYAPQSLADGDRSVTWGWLREARTEDAQWEAGWSGALSLPRVLDVADGALRQRPAPELRELRAERVGAVDARLAPDERRSVATGLALEVDARLAPAPDAAVELVTHESPAGTERTPVRYDGDRLTVERAESSRDPRTAHNPRSIPVGEGPLSLRAFVDGSVLALFADGRRCLTTRVYPTREDATGVSVRARGGSADVDLTAWRLDAVPPVGRE